MIYKAFWPDYKGDLGSVARYFSYGWGKKHVAGAFSIIKDPFFAFQTLEDAKYFIAKEHATLVCIGEIEDHATIFLPEHLKKFWDVKVLPRGTVFVHSLTIPDKIVIHKSELYRGRDVNEDHVAEERIYRY